MEEWKLGLFITFEGLNGIIATLIYPRARKAVGLERTGLYAFAAELAALTLCVISLWTPGSPSHMYKHAIPISKQDNCSDTSAIQYNATSELMSFNKSNMWVNVSDMTATNMSNSYVSGTPSQCVSRPLTSVVLYLVGITGSRIGKFLL